MQQQHTQESFLLCGQASGRAASVAFDSHGAAEILCGPWHTQMGHTIEDSEAVQLKHRSSELWLSLPLWGAGQGVSDIPFLCADLTLPGIL